MSCHFHRFLLKFVLKMQWILKGIHVMESGRFYFHFREVF